MRKHLLGLLVVLIVGAVCVVVVVTRAPDMATWPTFAAFRCRECGGAASVNPDCVEEWGCRECQFTTYGVLRRFRLAARSDFGGNERAWLAVLDEAGFIVLGNVYVSFDEETFYDRTPAGVWNRAEAATR